MKARCGVPANMDLVDDNLQELGPEEWAVPTAVHIEVVGHILIAGYHNVIVIEGDEGRLRLPIGATQYKQQRKLLG